MRSLAAAALCCALAACDNAPVNAPGEVSEGEAQALDQAAEMLDDQRLPDGVLPDIDPPADPANTPAEDAAEMTGDSTE